MVKMANEPTYTIIENGIDSTLTYEQVTKLLSADVIYECGECAAAHDDERIFHVKPDTELETQYLDATGPFAFLK